MATPESKLKPDTIVGGDYRVVRPLGAGGMGAVYVAEQLSTGSLRALKILHRDLAADEAELQRFLNEARLTARIPSDHVVQVLGAGRDADGAPWLAMELLEGESLAARVRRDGRLAPGAVQEVFAQLCHALGAAHAASIVHRDVKPENVFLAVPRREGPRFTLKVLDFGIAKLVAQVRRTATVPVGTPLWMAPEQSEVNPEIGPATDVWALGLLAFYLLTGKSYWLSGHAAQAGVSAFLRELLYEPLPAPSERARALQCADVLPAGFDDWFACCVCRQPSARFRDATAARAALVPLLGGPGATDPSAYTPPRDLGTPADGLAATEPAVGSAPTGVAPTPGSSQAATDPDPEPVPSASAAAGAGSVVFSAADLRPRAAPAAGPRRGLWAALIVCVGLLAVVVVLLVGRGGGRSPGAALPAPPAAPAPPAVVPTAVPAPPPASVPAAATPAAATATAATPAAASVPVAAPAPSAQIPRSGAAPKEAASAALPPETAADLSEAERLVAARDYDRASFLARRALRSGGGGRAYVVLVLVACGNKDLGAAKAHLAKVGRGQRARVERECQRLGLDLDPGRRKPAAGPMVACPPGQVPWEDGRCYRSCVTNRDCGSGSCVSFGNGRSGCL
jgi:eukaryotic-like serine/threonine-protein kinase